MKKSIFFAVALMISAAINAQTIAIDGANADWADVPILTEPGAPILLKMIVPQDGVTLPDGAAYCLMIAGDHEQIKAGYPVIYTDADKDASTGSNPWFCVAAMGYEYEMATWSDGSSCAENDNKDIREMAIMKKAFSSTAFSGSIYAWLTFDWGKLYVPNSPEPSGDNWKWDQTAYKRALNVAPYAYLPLNGTFTPANLYSGHPVLAPGDVMDMKVAGSANDTLVWGAWAVELTAPCKYAIKANIASTNTASVDLQLVSVATNAVVASFRSGDLSEGAEVAVGEWDLTAVPAGKYMLKFSNHVAWSEMQLKSLTLTGDNIPAAVPSVITAGKSQKVIRNGQVLILRDGKTFNALGTEIK